MDDQAVEELLRRRSEADGATGGPLCGDPELLAAYAEGSLDADAREQLQSHLAACSACRDSVVTLVRIAPREVVAEPARNRWRIGVWAVPALAALAVSIVVWKTPKPAAPQPVVAVAEKPPAFAQVNEEAKDLRRDNSLDKKKTARQSPTPANAPAPPPPRKPASQLTSGMVVADMTAAAPAAPPPATGAVAAEVSNSQQMVYPYAQQYNQALRTDQKAAAPMAAMKVAAAVPVHYQAKGGVLSFSPDGGTTWRVVITPEPVESFKFTDDKTGEITCYSKRVYRTKDGGAHWEAALEEIKRP